MKIILLSLSLFVLISCGGETQFLHHGDQPDVKTHNGKYPIKSILNNTKVDILWVVDNSGSMSNIQQNIVNNAQTFMDEFLKNKFLKWKMGLISTDRDEDGYIGFRTPFDYTSANPTRLFQTAVSDLGVNGSPSEYVFFNVNRILFDSSNNFLRSGAHLAVIMVSDEKEQSHTISRSLYERSVFLSNFKKNFSSNQEVRFYGAFELPDLKDCTNREEKYAGSPYEYVINQTNGFHLSACTNNFGQNLGAIGADIVKLIKSPSILLKERPVVTSIRVTYKGNLLPGGPESRGGYWYYNDYYNTVNFYNLNFAPDFDNDSISIDFDIQDGINDNQN